LRSAPDEQREATFAATLDDVHDVAGRYLARGQMANASMDVIAQLLSPSVDGEHRQMFARSGEVIISQALECPHLRRFEFGLLLFPRDIDALLCCEISAAAMVKSGERPRVNSRCLPLRR